MGVVMNALANISDVPKWSPVHKRAEVLDTYEDGRPHHVKVAIQVFKVPDEEILEFHWGPDWLVWDAEATALQTFQHVEYNLKRVGLDATRVRFEVTVEPANPISVLTSRRGITAVLQAATEGLRSAIRGEKPPFG